jgi:hypothetical protein
LTASNCKRWDFVFSIGGVGTIFQGYFATFGYLHILAHGDQEFWLMPIAHSGPCRSRILAQADQ